MITSAKFIISNTDYKKCPPAKYPEIAFIGRSNVGKSSLINMLCCVKELAKTSSKPGKTQLINHFDINGGSWYLVDLPGYGYAKVSKDAREKFKGMIASYITKRENLYCTFVLIDSRLDPQKIDIEFINFLGENGIPFALIFTKADKLSKGKIEKNITLFKEELLKTWETLPAIFVSSAETKLGKEDIINYIESII